MHEIIRTLVNNCNIRVEGKKKNKIVNVMEVLVRVLPRLRHTGGGLRGTVSYHGDRGEEHKKWESI